MGTGNPPRHSKSPDEPVTIDLAADAVTPAATAEPAAPDEATVAPEPGGGEPAETAAATDDIGESADRADQAAEDASTTPEPNYASDPAATPEPVAAIARRPAATSGLIAAGIVGGIVALAGAGALQYAGVLPGLSPSISRSADDTGFAQQIEALKQQIATLSAGTTSGAGSDIEARLAALESAAQTPAADAGTVTALEGRLAALTGTLDQLKTGLARTEQSQTASDSEISRRLEDAEKKLNEPRDDVEVARAIAAAALKTAIDRGGPFLAELDTLAGVTPDDPTVATLRDFAATGVLSRADLARRFPDVATAILEAIDQPQQGDGLTGRLLSSAMSLVKVRPVGNVAGEGADAIVARMEEKLANGDLKGAALEWDRLPEAGKAVSGEFKAALDDRLRVEDLIGTAMTKAVSSKQG